MMLFLDTEFNGFGGEIISVAIAAEAGGPNFYEVVAIPDVVDPWVAQNVIPLLGKQPIGLKALRSKLHSYLRLFADPVIVCDWHADAGHFFNLLSGADYASSLDFACTLRLLKTPPGKPVSIKPHNALYDAIALRDWYLMEAA